MQDIAQEIVILRGSRHWTQQQLADRIGTTQRTVAAWESGASVPRRAMRARIAIAFGLSEDYFLRDDLREEEKEPRQERGQEAGVQDLARQLGEVLERGEDFLSEDTQKSCLDLYQRILRETGLDGMERKK